MLGLVELAVLLPFLMFLFIAAVDFARLFYHSVTLANCARNGAILGSADPTHAADAAGIRSAALADATNLDPAPTITSRTFTEDGVQYVEVTADWQFQTVANYPGIPKLVNLQQKVQARVSPVLPNFP